MHDVSLIVRQCVAHLSNRVNYHRLQLKQLVQYQMFSAWPGALCTVKDSKVPSNVQNVD